MSSSFSRVAFFAAVALSWTLANFDRVDTPILQAFQMSTGIFARSRARPGPTKNPTYPHILGHSARPPLRKLAKVELRLSLTLANFDRVDTAILQAFRMS